MLEANLRPLADGSAALVEQPDRQTCPPADAAARYLVSLGYHSPMTEWIAQEKVVFVHADGKRVTGRIAVAAPVAREEDCACEVVMEGLERSYTIYGDSTLQALLLGVRFLGMRLHEQRSRGLRIELDTDEQEASDNTDEDIDVISVLFGSLLSAPSGPGPAGE
jgi:hypothetical protein